MAATRLNDAQKQELIDRFRGGAGTQELATAYECSPNTVIRVVKAAIEPSLYEELKRQRGRRGLPAAEEQAAQGQAAAIETSGDSPEPPQPLVEASESPTDPAFAANQNDAPHPNAGGHAADAAGEHEAAGALAIDDADDFDDFDGEAEDEEDSDGDQEDEPPGASFIEQTFVEVPISLGEALDQPLTIPRPWRSDELPAAAYLLVDKTVELQPRPLAEIPELGRLEAEERELQALVLYSNPRQAKRHCGRTQRVIKLPDVGLLERRAPYLLRQGIRRVVIEGALYALPEG